MEGAPYGPWRVVASGEQATPRLIQGVKGEVLPIYTVLARLGLSAREVDECEIWQIAAMLGVGVNDTARPDVPFSKGGRDPNLSARIARGRGEEPEWVEVRSYHPDLVG